MFQSELLYRQCRIKADTMKRPAESPQTRPCCGPFRVAWIRVFAGHDVFLRKFLYRRCVYMEGVVDGLAEKRVKYLPER